MGLQWTDSEEIGIRLYEKMPQQNPLEARFTDLRNWVCALDDFDDDPQLSNEAKLEAIQMAWLEEYQDANGKT